MIIIDPATARAIAYAVQKIIEDEETRKRILYIITIPIVIVILLLSTIHYIFTMPVDALANYFDIDIMSAVTDFIDDFGYGYGYAGDYAIENIDYSQYESIDPELFEKLMAEATKYLGYPYVWGGSSPLTSFDCSGFICWAYTKSGVYQLPRTTAQGIYNQCQTITRNEAVAGDLVFFKGTYNSTGAVSHIGIYIGDGIMLHCGDPIGYANIDTAYWQKHFYDFGRLPILSDESEEG